MRLENNCEIVAHSGHLPVSSGSVASGPPSRRIPAVLAASSLELSAMSDPSSRARIGEASTGSIGCMSLRVKVGATNSSAEDLGSRASGVKDVMEEVGDREVRPPALKSRVWLFSHALKTLIGSNAFVCAIVTLVFFAF